MPYADAWLTSLMSKPSCTILSAVPASQQHSKQTASAHHMEEDARKATASSEQPQNHSRLHKQLYTRLGCCCSACAAAPQMQSAANINPTGKCAFSHERPAVLNPPGLVPWNRRCSFTPANTKVCRPTSATGAAAKHNHQAPSSLTGMLSEATGTGRKAMV